MHLLRLALEAADTGTAGLSPWAWLGPQVTLAVGAVVLLAAQYKVQKSDCREDIDRAEKREIAYRERIDRLIEQNAEVLEVLKRAVALMEVFADELRDRHHGK